MHPSADKNPLQVEPEHQVVKSELLKKDEPAKPIFTVDINKRQCTMHSTSENAEETAPLEAGPNGLLVAKFGESVHESELSNLMLLAPAARKKRKVLKRPAAAPPEAEAPSEAVLKRPAAAPPKAVLKRPAAAPSDAEAPSEAETPSEAEAPSEADVPPVEAKDDYGIMWYGKAKAIAIRAKFGAKATVFQFGGVACTKTEVEMRDIGKVIVADLHAGMSPAKAKKKGQRLAGL